MKKIMITILLGFFLLVPFASADTVNMNVSVNGTANLNITVDADDTLARQMINETQEDVYGTIEGSGPKDVVLNEIENMGGNPIPDTGGLSSINEICNNPSLQQYFNGISGLPPQGFVDYLKALGYDDQGHMTTIWTMCQQEYINQHQGQWSQDLIGGGIQQGDLVSIFDAAINWLTGGGESVYSNAKKLAMILESYFASDKDVWYLANRIKQLELRVEALERTVEIVSSEEYCEVKLDMMKEYNLTGVKCGVNSTQYWNARKAGFDNYETIAYRDCNEDWICTDWSECKDGEQTRKCVDKYDCGTFYEKPEETKECAVSIKQIVEAPFVADTKGSEVEEYLAIEELLVTYFPILLLIFVTTAASLIYVGVRKDSKKIKRSYRFSYRFKPKTKGMLGKIKSFLSSYFNFFKKIVKFYRKF